MHARLTLTPHARRRADPLRGLVAGTFAGLMAAGFMNGFQALASSLQPKSDAPPATEKAADAVSRALTGHDITPPEKHLAGELVHYAYGAALGAIYGLAAESARGVTAGAGSVFGVVSLAADEFGVPAVGLGPRPEDTPPATHAYAAASHLVFGMSAEAVRRLLRG